MIERFISTGWAIQEHFRLSDEYQLSLFQQVIVAPLFGLWLIGAISFLLLIFVVVRK